MADNNPYDYAHRKARKQAIEMMPEGTPCWRCGRPMFKRQALDYDHIRSIAMGGADGPKRLAHRSCNRSAGATLGNKIRGKRRAKGIPPKSPGNPARSKLPKW